MRLKTLIKCLLVLFILTRIALVRMFPKNPLGLELTFKGALRTCVPKPVKTRPLVYKYLYFQALDLAYPPHKFDRNIFIDIPPPAHFEVQKKSQTFSPLTPHGSH